MRNLLRNIVLATLSLSLGVAGVPKPKNESEPALVKRADPQTQGCDLSSLQGSSVNFNELKSVGIRFAYIQATGGITFTNSFFDVNSFAAATIKIIGGAYHVAQLTASTGAAQAMYFLNNGGRWSPGVLPGAVYLQGDCAGYTVAEIVSWIQDFCDTYQSVTGRYPVIYTTTSFWIACTGNTTIFSSNSPLWISSESWDNSTGTLVLPGGWSDATILQYNSSDPSTDPGPDSFNGYPAKLDRFVAGP